MSLNEIRDYLDWKENQKMDFFEMGYTDADVFMSLESNGDTLSDVALAGLCESITNELSSVSPQRRRDGSTVMKREYSDANRYREGFLQRMREGKG
jgi:hypothetical protein